MYAAQTIREAVARVTRLRSEAASSPSLNASIRAVKSLQARRFAGTYTDLLSSSEFSGAAHFFLEDLYSDRDYSARDAQFSRIAGALQRFFPKQVVETAVSLAQVHLLTEELDRLMAVAWLNEPIDQWEDGILRYMACWKSVGRKDDRSRQLSMVLRIGADLDRLTRTPGLRLMLKMMRRPAVAAGLGSLQDFLETGFDTFATMSAKGARAQEFLNTIGIRESYWIDLLSNGGVLECQSALQTCLARTDLAPEKHTS